MIIPPLFRCPISLDLFQDPVTLCTGQTYDRACIEKWLSAGNSRCPITMQKLEDTSMVPNHTLRHLIHQWLLSDTTRISEIVESDGSSMEDKLQALESIHSLSLSQRYHPPLTARLFQLVLHLILGNEQSLIVVEKALVCALELMPFAGMGIFFKQEPNYARFLLLLEQSASAGRKHVGIQKSLCLMVEAISLCPHTKHVCEENLVRIIVGIIIGQGQGQGSHEAAIRAASALSLTTESNRNYMVSQGAVEGLILYLSSDSCRDVHKSAIAMSTIENLLSVGAAKDAILNHPWGVKAIVKMVFRVSEHQGSESAVNSLLIICSDSTSGTQMAIIQGLLTQLLLLLQSQCNATTKTKARKLLNLLRG
ncbi:hypothetical protein ACS0TY_006444 [Phlomoides rotata]